MSQCRHQEHHQLRELEGEAHTLAQGHEVPAHEVVDRQISCAPAFDSDGREIGQYSSLLHTHVPSPTAPSQCFLPQHTCTHQTVLVSLASHHGP